VVAYPYNPSTQEAEAGGSQLEGQPGLHSETLSQKTNKKKNKKKKKEKPGKQQGSKIILLHI
jgi:hypothetical protein